MSTGPSSWLLALESSTPYGGVAMLRDGAPADEILLEEGLRHGRELVSAAAALLKRHGLAPRDLFGVAVSAGPGSYTGVRVGVMAAKALAYGAGIRLAAVSSLAALAQTIAENGAAAEGDTVFTLQDARRDEVYAGVYRIANGIAAAHQDGSAPDAAITPEEAAVRLRELFEKFPSSLRLAGSGFATYKLGEKLDGRVSPSAVGVLGWRALMEAKNADPLQIQPVYLRRDEGADYRHDHLITKE